ncbi:MAG: hypothetical protein H6684_16045 [Deltaproteobacteria bacterium]|nr:hypothetical protein [bacterium]MCB9478048.1 hypothetical protein [Deltaproteobacteria bacterium]MCB9490243.1 hypothetical protein [Deltaproteobacteria bacterium]
MRRAWAINGILLVAGLMALAACTKKPEPIPDYQKDPASAVLALMDAIAQFKDSDTTAVADKEAALAKINLLFGERKEQAKPVIGLFMLVNMKDVEVVSVDTHGDSSDVTVKHSVRSIGIGGNEMTFGGDNTKESVFQLRNVDGRWIIWDLGGILDKHGR